MSQAGPPTESMRIVANHGSFVAVRVRKSAENVVGRLKTVLDALGLKPEDEVGASRRTSFRQDPAPMSEVAVFPARHRWVLVVPSTHDEELLAVLAGRLSGRCEVLAVTWHRATDYHRIHRFFAGKLTRHTGVYGGDLIRSTGERLSGEAWDEGDFRARLVEAPAELADWLIDRELDPMQDRTGVAATEDAMSILKVGGRLERAEILRLYLDEVDPGFSVASEELGGLS